MYVTRRPCEAKPQVKGAQGPVGQPNALSGQPHFELVQVETWWLHSYIGLQEYPMLESRWKLGGGAGRPRGWTPGRPSPPNRLN
jgi:hypothetical protein